jgi:hypothetical protein
MKTDTQHLEFEAFLKQQADSFKMKPNERVWHGIYNNLHPSRRFPSLAVASLFVFAFLLFSVSSNKRVYIASNQNVIQTIDNNTNTEITLSEIKENIVDIGNSINSKEVENARLMHSTNASLASISQKSKFKAAKLAARKQSLPTANNTNVTIKNEQSSNEEVTQHFLETKQDNASNITNANIEEAGIAALTSNDIDNAFVSVTLNEAVDKVISNDPLKVNAAAKSTSSVTLAENTALDDTKFKENDIFLNKPKQSIIEKFLTNGSITYHLAANKSFRQVNSNVINDNVLIDKAALGLEFGATANYPVTENTSLTVGAQFNYNNYISQLSNNWENINGVTSYTLFSYKADKQRFNNSSAEISLPIGVNYAIYNGNNTKIIANVQAQPSILLGGSAHVFDETNKQVRQQNDVLRKFNVHTAAGLLVQVKTAKNVAVQFGPQIRYQLFSNHKNNFNYKESLQSFGLKLGVVKRF